jgi:Flp pilus assembly protein TadG
MLCHIKNRTHARHRSRGQTLVEVTLIIPLLILLVGAALDWGLVFFVSHVVQNAVRSGARVAVTEGPTVSGTNVRNEVRRLMPDTPLFASFRNNATIQVSCIAPTGPAANPTTPPFLQVQTTGPFSFYFMRLIGLSTTTITRDTTMKYERALTCPTIT